jgi:hypothetical protein
MNNTFRVKPENRKLKIAMDVGKSTGLNNIGLLNREDEHRLLFETALIVLLYFDEELYKCPYADIDSLLSNYSEFKKCDQRELSKLLSFANFMNCAIRLLPAKGNYICTYVYVIERLITLFFDLSILIY